ncbi:MAG: hypothetical protein HY714_01850, partial [Candidatus Omnitrophica bacterium]|nr:hypothetical protein [Candidatus Omnitrophota bacterium]
DGMGGSRDPNLDFYKDVYYPQDAALDAAGKSETEKARYFYGKGREFIASAPREFAALYLRKLALFVDPRMTAEIGGRKTVIWEPGYLAVLVGVLAAWFRSKWGEAERRAALVFAGIMLYFWAMHGLTVATGRFRFPLEPLLIILASRALRVERSRS